MVVPLGYGLKDRKLFIMLKESEKVRCIFNRRLLYQMLANSICLGEIVHQGKAQPGKHDGIIDRETFEKVCSLISSNRVR